MANSEKIAFSSLIAAYNDKQQLEELQLFLKDNCNINARLGYYDGHNVIFVANDEDYLKALTYGSLYCMQTKKDQICWVSPKNTKNTLMCDIAVDSKKCLNNNKFLDMKAVKELLKNYCIRYSAQFYKKFDYSIPNINDKTNDFEEDEEELPNIDDMI